MADKITQRKRRKPEGIYLRVEKGALVPADGYARNQLKAKGYHTGDVVSAQIKKLNNPKFDRLIHRIGQLCAANIEAFHGMGAHQVLKKLQIESNTHCEELPILLPEMGIVARQRIPLSLSFEEVDDGERHEIGRAFCRWIAKTYWPDMTPEAVEEMAESFLEEA